MTVRRLSISTGCLLLIAVQTGLTRQTSEKDKDKNVPEPFAGSPIGKPKAFKTGGSTMCAVWHDGEFWNIHTTGKKQTKGASALHRWGGSIRIEGDTYVGKFDKLEASKKAINADWVVPHIDGRGFDFQLLNRGHRDELKFKVGSNATSITMKIVCDNKSDTKKILIGRKSENPGKTLFTVPAHPKKE